MTNAQEMLNYIYWHVYFDWISPLFLALGICVGLTLAKYIREKVFNWKYTVFMLVVSVIVSYILITTVEYISFVHVCKDNISWNYQ